MSEIEQIDRDAAADIYALICPTRLSARGIPGRFRDGELDKHKLIQMLSSHRRPAPSAERDEVIEECAAIAKRVFEANPGEGDFASGSRAAAAGIDAAIRALKSQPSAAGMREASDA